MNNDEKLMTTQKQIREAFWESYSDANKKKTASGDYVTNTRVLFCDFVEMLYQTGCISDELAQRVTLG